MTPSIKPFVGSWKIVEMELWDVDYIDLVVPGFIRFEAEDGDNSGDFRFGAVAGAVHALVELRDGTPCVEWTWEGEDEGDPRYGRGWARIEEGRLVGKIYFHRGDSSSFVAVRSITKLTVDIRSTRRPRRRP